MNDGLQARGRDPGRVGRRSGEELLPGARRADLMDHGVDVSEILHREPGNPQAPGPDPEHTTYNSFATFEDPDDDHRRARGASARDRRAPRPVREERRAAQLVGLVAAYMDARRSGSSP